MENSTEFYFEKLSNETNPGRIIAAMYASLYDIQVTKSEIILMNKLIKIFGRFTVFFSVLDLAGTYPEKIENPYPLLYTICKKKFEQSHGGVFIPSHISLKKYADELAKERDAMRNKKIKAPSSKGLE